jgi:hypothetical protein
LDAPRRPGWRRFFGWAVVLTVVGLATYALVDLATSPFAEARLLGNLHPEIVVRREWDPRHGWFLYIRDDLPTDCPCPLHRMLSGQKAVTIGWHRFFDGSARELTKTQSRGNHFRGHDLLPQRRLLMSRVDQGTFRVHLIEYWSPAEALRGGQEVLSNLLRAIWS